MVELDYDHVVHPRDLLMHYDEVYHAVCSGTVVCSRQAPDVEDRTILLSSAELWGGHIDSLGFDDV
jgi:hypothetical protein